jgi:(+)-neomenthol dehydrogenase
LQSRELAEEMADVGKLSEARIDAFVGQYLEDVESGAWASRGRWPAAFPSYKVSKIALHMYTRVLARELLTQHEAGIGPRIDVNCIHPGYVRTEMTHNFGDRSPREGALFVLRLALLPPAAATSGQFFDEDRADGYY